MTLFVKPLPPVIQLRSDCWISCLDVVEHEVVEIPLFAADHNVPVAAIVIDDPVNVRSLLTLRVINSRETGEIPLELRVFLSTSRKTELSVRLDFEGCGNSLLAMLRINLNDLEFFQ